MELNFEIFVGWYSVVVPRYYDTLEAAPKTWNSKLNFHRTLHRLHWWGPGFGKQRWYRRVTKSKKSGRSTVANNDHWSILLFGAGGSSGIPWVKHVLAGKRNKCKSRKISHLLQLILHFQRDFRYEGWQRILDPEGWCTASSVLARLMAMFWNI